MNRRTLLTALGACLGSGVAPAARAQEKKKVLFFSRSAGFEHAVIARKNGMPAYVEPILAQLAERNALEMTFTKDGGIFSSPELNRFDAFFFYTTGDLTGPSKDGAPPMTAAGKAALLEAVRGGKGFVGTHSATDTFHTQPDPPDRSNRYLNHGEAADPYVRMIGAEFIKHGKQQVATMRCVNPRFPGMGPAGERFSLMEEWYSLKDFQPDLHVLLVQETEGMEGADYRRPPYPATWARRHGRGRVFYTSMGHREDVWTNAVFQSILLGGLSWAVGHVDAEVKPNISQVTPGHAVIPPRA